MNKEDFKKELNAIIKSNIHEDAVGEYSEFYLEDLEKLFEDMKKEHRIKNPIQDFNLPHS